MMKQVSKRATADTVGLARLEKSTSIAEIVVDAAGTGIAFQMAPVQSLDIFRRRLFAAPVETYRPVFLGATGLGATGWEISLISTQKEELASLRQEVERLRTANARLSASVGSPEVARALVETVEPAAEMDYEEAKARIVLLFEERGKVSYSDIIDKLSLDLETTIEACDELVAEGKIREC